MYGRQFFPGKIRTKPSETPTFISSVFLVYSVFHRFRAKRISTKYTANDRSPPKTIATSFRRPGDISYKGSFDPPDIGASRPIATTEVLLIFRYCRTSLIGQVNESDRQILNDNTTVIIADCLVKNTLNTTHGVHPRSGSSLDPIINDTRIAFRLFRKNNTEVVCLSAGTSTTIPRFYPSRRVLYCPRKGE